MPRSKVGVKKPPVNAENLKKAIEAVLAPSENNISLREACTIYNVKLATLSRNVTKFRNSESVTFEYRSNLDVKKVFSEEEENNLLKYIKQVARMNYGLTKKGVRELAYKFAFANNKRYPEGWDDQKIAGEEWMRGFMRRHPDLSVRKPRATSLSRATSFNRTNVTMFYENIEKVHKRYGTIPPERIWNCDESGLSTVQTPVKVVAERGARQLGSVTSAERGSLVTILTAVNAIGNSTPPMLIFPRVNYKDMMLYGAPPGSIGGATVTGWSNEHTFVQFLKHFIKLVKPTKEERIIFLMDNHGTHLSPEALDLASDNGIVMVTFPPHCSHKLQPLDVTLFGPLKTFYNQYVDAWLLNHPGQTFNIYGVASVVGQAYPRAFTPTNITQGFKATGTHPFNKNIFTDEDFLPSYVTDRPNPVPCGSNKCETIIQQTFNDAANLPSSSTSMSNIEVSNSPSTLPDISLNIDSTEQFHPSSLPKKCFSLEEIQPFPKAQARKNTKRGKKPGKTMIATDTPEKTAIKMAKEQKKKTDGKTTFRGKEVKRKLQLEKKKEPLKKRVFKKKRFVEDLSSDEDEDPVPLVETDDEDSNDEECLFCCEAYQNDLSGEQWIRCMTCKRWAHELCAGTDKHGWKNFICDHCRG